MSNLQIKDLPEDVHEELRQRARYEGTSVRSYVLQLILEDQQLEPRQLWLARVRARRPVDLGRPVAELIAQDRALGDSGTAASMRRRPRSQRKQQPKPLPQ